MEENQIIQMNSIITKINQIPINFKLNQKHRLYNIQNKITLKIELIKGCHELYLK